MREGMDELWTGLMVCGGFRLGGLPQKPQVHHTSSEVAQDRDSRDS